MEPYLETASDVITQLSKVTEEDNSSPGDGRGQSDVIDVSRESQAGASIIIGLIGLFGNGLVLVVLSKYGNLRKRVYAPLLGNQSVADIGISICLIVFNIIVLAVPEPAGGVPLYLFCGFADIGFLHDAFISTSTLNLMAFTFERYLSIVHNKWHKILVSKVTVAVVIASVWILPLGFTFVSNMTAVDIKNGNCIPYHIWPTKNYESVKAVFEIIVYSFIPIFLISYCYTHMLFRLWKHSKVTRQLRQGLQTQVTHKDQFLTTAQINLTKTFILVAAFFLICYVPETVLVFLRRIHLLTWASSKKATHYLETLVYVNSSINPFIYAAKYSEFRNGLAYLRKKYSGRVTTEGYLQEEERPEGTTERRKDVGPSECKQETSFQVWTSTAGPSTRVTANDNI